MITNCIPRCKRQPNCGLPVSLPRCLTLAAMRTADPSVWSAYPVPYPPNSYRRSPCPTKQKQRSPPLLRLTVVLPIALVSMGIIAQNHSQYKRDF